MTQVAIVYSTKVPNARDDVVNRLGDDEVVLIDMEDILKAANHPSVNSSYIIAIADALDMCDRVIWSNAKEVYNDPLSQAVITIAEVLKMDICYRDR